LFNYPQSFAALFLVISTMGLDGIVIRDLVKKKWTHKFAQPYKWISCSQIGHDLSRQQEQRNGQMTQKKPYGTLQGKSRIRGHQLGQVVCW
jgi:hypothetical protein|tara:strand:- start:80 stop:352 length:273 start_codon:yes stop_codon:yes gene_type:complete